MKSRPDQLFDLRMRTLLLLLGLSGAGLVAVGVIDGFAASWRPRYWVWIALGLVAMLNALGDHAFAKSLPSEPHAWLAKHISCMIGCGIAYDTALMIAGARHFLEPLLPGHLMVIPWTLPTLIGWPAAALLVHRYARGPATGPGRAATG